jgi:hypothetical protein
LTHDDFAKYNRQLNDKIDGIDPKGPDANARRLYVQTRRALQDEYYTQIAQNSPEVANQLKDANTAYSQIRSRLEEGPAKAAFANKSPEKIIGGVLNGSVSETQVDDILKTMNEATPSTIRPSAGPESRDYSKDFANSVYYNHLQKFAARSADGVPVRIRADEFLTDLLGPKKDIFERVYGDDYEHILAAARQDATQQYKWERNMKVEGWGAGTLLGGSALLELGLQLFGSNQK